MKTVIIRSVLVLCILLLNGFSHQYANTGKECSYSTVIFQDSVKVIASGGEHIKSFISRPESPYELEIVEIEEDKFLSFKAYLKGVDFFTILFHDLTPGHFFGYINKSESIAKPYLERTSTISFVTFQVFRI